MPIVTVEAVPQVIATLVAGLDADDFRVSLPVSTESPADALDAPIGPQEIQQTLEIVTIAFKAGSAALVFIARLRTALENKDQSATVRDAKSGKVRAVVRADTPDDRLQSSLED